MLLKSISKSEFKQIDPARQILVHEYPRQFAMLDLGQPLGCYGLSWESSSHIQPVIERSTDRRTLWIGVDRRLAAIDLQQGNVCISLSVIMPIFQILIVEDLTAILTELEVLLFSANRTLKCFDVLPDLTANISVYGSDFMIQMFDGSSFTLTRTGLIKPMVPAMQL